MPEEQQAIVSVNDLIQQFVERFADCTSRQEFDSALAWAALAQGRWMALNAERFKATAEKHHREWPFPGDPAADDIDGWTGWYGGGYGGALA